MKKLLTFLFVIFIASFSHAQWLVESFDNAVGNLFPDPPILNTNFFADGPTAEFNLSNDPDAYEGTGSMKMDYRVEASDSWGGYVVRTTYIGSETTNEPPYMDFSTGTALKFRYKVLTPADTTKAGSVFMEIKLAEYDQASSGRDLIYHHTAINPFDDSGEWIEVSMPLEYNSDNTLGFSFQNQEGDGIIQWDKIKGFEFTAVYITAGGAVNTPVATGSVLIDKLELVGNRYTPFQTFDNAATGVFDTDYMSWAGTGASSITFSNNTTDFVEGTGSLQMDYTVNASQSWGGYLNLTDSVFVPDSNFNERTALVFYVKNVNPFVGTTPGRVTMRFFLMENSTGANEDWVCEVPVNFEQAGDWTRYYLPLKQDTVWTDEGGHTRFPQQGFAQPWWSLTGDQTFNPESVYGYKIELSAGGSPEYGAIGETFTGTLLFDVIQQSGFQFADKTPPDPPTINIIHTTVYSNLVSWLDVPGENGEKYFVYTSANPITDINADGVLLEYYPEPIPHGTQVYEHVLRSANTDKLKTFYYAVTCKDFAGNISVPATAGPVTNTAKGVPTVSITPPSPFVADGIFSEWSDAQPSFVMQNALGTAYVPANYIVDGDNDLSAVAKLAIDQDYLYVMMDVTDDVYNHPLDINPWERDEPDLYIGLYNLTKTHIAYGTGATADYQIRFDKDRVRLDAATDCDSLLMAGPDYYFHEKFPSGYVLEAKISLADLASKRNADQTSTDVINWKVGDRIPFTIGINDNDGDGRVGMIFYYPQPTEQAYQNVAAWGYTWISDDVTGVNDQPNTVNTYNLSQNYPNPFNPTTQIQYSIAEAGLVSVKVFDILGREVANLVNRQQAAGTYTVDFNANGLATGVYIYRVESGSFQATKKMILLK